MKLFTSQNTATVSRLTYSGGKGTYSSVGTINGTLRPLSVQEASMNDMQWGKSYSFICETSANIKQGDQVTINSTLYSVKGVVQYGTNNGFTAYIKALIVLPEKT